MQVSRFAEEKDTTKEKRQINGLFDFQQFSNFSDQFRTVQNFWKSYSQFCHYQDLSFSEIKDNILH